MNGWVTERWWGYELAFEHPATTFIAIGIGVVFAFAVVAIGALTFSRKLPPALIRELWLRTASWLVLVLVLGIPILAGALWTMLLILAISLLCFHEYARATGLFREKLVSFTVILGILFVFFAAIDHWYGFFQALVPLTVVGLAVISIPLDRPSGYVQRVALAIFGFLVFGVAFGHLAFMANDWHYRPIVLMVLIAVSLNDVFAFVIGKLVGGPKLVPVTSPNKTLAGSLGAMVLTTTLVALLAGLVFEGTTLEQWPHRIGLGLIVGALAQLGDLMLSSIKRDLGIKDMGNTIPGHGGVLDRFNSLLLVAPATFHYVGYFIGFGVDQPTRIFTGI
ncbi:MAG: phosphatidate cytidylyltransferase [Alphaproteobacteria bacterium]